MTTNDPQGYVFVGLGAVDTWFFREPRPFHAEESVAGGMLSLFPPPCRTVVGTLRAALARAAGWEGSGAWPPEITAVLGSGDDLAGLSYLGPVLISGETAFYPLPRQALGKSTASGWQPTAVLAPGEALECDLGAVRLPVAVGWQGEDLKGSAPPDGIWGTAAALQAVLAGRPPDSGDTKPLAALVHPEDRVGIRRDPTTRTVAENALYAARHWRPKDETRVVAGLAGLPSSWPRPDDGTLVPFGGEGRAAVWRPVNPPAYPDPPPVAAISRRYSVTFLTSALLPSVAWQPGAELPGLPGRVVAACCGEPVRLGGWQGWQRTGFGPVAAQNAVPPGATWFFELDAPAGDSLLELHGRHFDPGGWGRWGFGRMAIGAWSPGKSQGDVP